ncbi:SRPBCC family protein [Terriglobus saanensis]|uniref:Polyketide cyclase/dehydrase n=1 Tax=Terriglobus saanensis (strain ATCC BAA-1853 / DSM 23119 / SP1PR4) TaxID=401053 RepID=E8V3T0_TERSS|nr:SRPBCC family protein [Terriglobus saanensis]ADV84767.1 Polyketide cyclase/dehydrase [Terriglobus saanensis SP1PR4]
MLRKIMIIVVLLVVVLLLYASRQPDMFHVERSLVIAAAPEKIYPLIDDFHQWHLWSPWDKIDPAAKIVIGTPSSGPGATYAWEGNRKVGAGTMVILDDAAPTRVHIKLDFLKPMAGTSENLYTLTPEAGGTRVTWLMTGPMSFVSKIMCVFVSMDKMVGGDFDRGLANMKAVAER